MTTTVTAVFQDRDSAEDAVRALLEAGYEQSSISVVVRDTPEHEAIVREETEDMQRGALAGALAGGVFAGLLAGVLAIPGLGLIAAGPVLAALAAGGTGAAAGGVLGAFVAHGLSAQVAQEYETALQQGGVVVGVHTVRTEAAKARTALESHGGTHLSDSVHFGSHYPHAGHAEKESEQEA